jgi:hypothetical protein
VNEESPFRRRRFLRQLSYGLYSALEFFEHL